MTSKSLVIAAAGTSHQGGGSTGTTSTVTTSVDPYFDNVSLLLNFDNNLSFKDTSTNNFPIIKTGNVTPSLNSPFANGIGGSLHLDGSSYLSTTNGATPSGAGDYTVEAWVNFSSVASSAGLIAGNGVDNFLLRCGTGYGSAIDGLQIIATNDFDAEYCNYTFAVDQWYHIAVTRASDVVYFFVNGEQQTTQGSGTASFSFVSPTTTYIGQNGDGTELFPGYISNLRVVNGRSLYGGPTYVVPTAPFPTNGTTDSNYNSVVLQLNGDGTNGANNNTFLDSSTSSFTINTSGSPVQGSFSPFSKLPGEWSTYFDGSSYLTSSNGIINVGTGDFTIEFWFNVNDTNSTYYLFDGRSMSGDSSLNLSLQTFTHLGVTGYYVCFDQGSYLYNQPISANTWYHVAVTHITGKTIIYINGVAQSILTPDNTNYVQTSNFTIGAAYDGTNPFVGYISNLRVVKDLALSSSLDYFTVPAKPLSVVPGTSLLFCQSNRFVDHSPSVCGFILYGQPVISTFSPFSNTTTYSPALNGGSVYFSSSGNDYLEVAGSSTGQFTLTGDFTIECWFNITSFPAVGYGENSAYIISGGSDRGGYGIRVDPDGTLHFLYAEVSFVEGGAVVTPGTWNHVAAVRSSGVITLYVNGTFYASSSVVDPLISQNTWAEGASTIKIGRMDPIGGFIYPYNGYVSNVRISNNTAFYTANFTPSLAPLQSNANNTLLLNFTNAGIVDLSGTTDIQTVGTAQVSSTQQLFSKNTYYFDGSSCLELSNNAEYNFGTGDFTVEYWIYPPSWPTDYYPTAIDFRGTGDGAYADYFDTSGYFHIWQGPGLTSSSPVPTAQWSHIAVSRYQGTTNLYINGVLEATATNDTTNWRGPVGAPATVGSGKGNSLNFVGYMSDIRVSKNARYTTPFIPPTAPLPTVTNTALLITATGQGQFDNSTFIDQSRNSVAVSVESGTPSYSGLSPYGIGNSSIYFDGASNLSFPASVPFNLHVLSTSPFTIEAWIHPTAPGGGIFSDIYTGGNIDSMVSLCRSNDATYTDDNYIGFGYYDGSWHTVISTVAVRLNQWSHVACVFDGSNSHIFINGINVTNGTLTSWTTTNSGNGWRLGCRWDGSSTPYFTGHITSFRWSYGARYKNSFRPPLESLPDNSTTDPYFNETVLLIHGDGISATNNSTVLDSSTNTFVISTSGEIYQGTFSPFSKPANEWGVYFDGSSYLTVDVGSSIIGTNDYTIEMWYNPQSLMNGAAIFSLGTSDDIGNMILYTNSDGSIRLYGDINDAWIASGSGLITANNWHHIAQVYTGGITTIYVNGESVGSYAVQLAMTNPLWQIAQGYGGIASSNPGSWSNVRVVVGKALYTTNFIPPTTPLTASTSTSLLACQSNRFIDNSANHYTLTTAGTPTVTTYSPFASTSTYSTTVNGGSMYFDGNSYLSLDGASMPYGTEDFTIELWVYWPPEAFTVGDFGLVCGTGYGGLGVSNYGNDIVLYYGGYSGINFGLKQQVVANQWNHLAVTKHGNDYRLFINGKLDSTGVQTVTGISWDFGSTQYIGMGMNSQKAPNTYLSNIRIVKGTAVYISNFTPPTAPVTAITNTSLLLNFTNAGVTDSTKTHSLLTSGNSQLIATTFPYGSTSLFFDGTGYVQLDKYSQDLYWWNGDTTIEAWIYSLSNYDQQSVGAIIGNMNWSDGSNSWSFGPAGSNNKLTFYSWNGGGTTITGDPIPLNRWIHIAAVYSNGVISLFIDGNLSASGSIGAASLDFNLPILIGGFNNSGFNGYVADLRVSKVARYAGPANKLLAPPADDKYTGVLMNTDTGAFYDRSSPGNPIKQGGTPVVTTQHSPFTTVLESGYFDGSSYLEINSNLNITASSDFTLEGWINLSVSQTNFLMIVSDGTKYISVVSNGIEVQFGNSGGTACEVTYSFATNTWYHIAVVRASNTVTVYINGISQTTSNSTQSNAFLDSGNAYIGTYDKSSYYWTGYMSNLRVTKGVARYTTSFTPPTTPFPVPIESATVRPVVDPVEFTPAVLPYTIDYFIVAGGGGGGAGGFAGAMAVTVIPGTAYTVVIGAGGGGAYGHGSQGSDSSFMTTTATGGGYGNSGLNGTGGGSGSHNGGSGGGGGGGAGVTGYGSANPLQGYNGSPGSSRFGEGGAGGGATHPGGAAASNHGGAGGSGFYNATTWDGNPYAAGGGGGQYGVGGKAGNITIGGGGGGYYQDGGNAVDRTGSGGGGGGGYSKVGGNGSSGALVIRYLGSQAGTGGDNIFNNGTYTFHQFFNSGTFTA